MTAINVCVGLLLAVIALLAVYLIRRLTKQQFPALGSQDVSPLPDDHVSNLPPHPYLH